MNYSTRGNLLLVLFTGLCGIFYVAYFIAGVNLPVLNRLSLIAISGSNEALPQKRNKSQMDLLWSELGGFKGTRFNDIDQVREFFRDRTMKWKIILRVGDIDFGGLSWKDGGNYLRWDQCPVPNCYFTSDQSAVDIADALVISKFGEKELRFFTPKRKNQIWIAQILEPPFHVRLVAPLLKGLINWTATYRRDSVINIPYGIWIRLNSTSTPSSSIRNYAHGKTKQVAMFVSNCGAISGRISYAMELNKTIPVDIYGRCGSLECPRNQTVACDTIIKKDYKFFLSFENSNCIGYITEKLHSRALSNDAIPIVMGARRLDYNEAAPPGSFIYVDDFQSPSHLGEYLRLLDSNDTLYNEYFRYKDRYRLVMWVHLGRFYWCQLCTRLHMMDYEDFTYWYDDFDQWWNNACSVKFDGNNTWRTWKGVSSLSNTIQTMAKSKKI